MGRLFGTDGIRGIANSELSCELALNVGKALGIILSEGISGACNIVVGHDTRISSNMLAYALMAGANSVGCNCTLLGVLPTPVVAFLVTKLSADAGVMITASHNPANYNGIKIFDNNGYKLPDVLEEKIEGLISSGFPLNNDYPVGSICVNLDASLIYSKSILSISSQFHSPLKVAFDCANGAASYVSREIFSSININPFFYNTTPDGKNINENCGSTHIETVRKIVLDNSFDCGFSFDGDADRCLAVDEYGNLIDGDVLLACLAVDLKQQGLLKNNVVVGTVMTNYGIVRFLEKNGIKFIASKVGDRYVLETMLLANCNLGGEQSGHIIFLDYSTTGDAQLTALQVLSLLNRTNSTLHNIVKKITLYPQVLINVAVSNSLKSSFYTKKEINMAIKLCENKLNGKGRVLVRPSGTEPLIRIMVEGENKDDIESFANYIATVIKNEIKTY
jgi:phosphoglucosamine mutase